MKRFIIILFWIITLLSNAATYYVAPTTATPAGSDLNAGTLAAPWATFNKAALEAYPGDTIYFRGGTYSITARVFMRVYGGTARDGTVSDPICYFAYPADLVSGNRPIFDCSGLITPERNPKAFLLLYEMDYLKFNGLLIRNVFQDFVEQNVYTVYKYRCTNIYFDNCVIHNVGWFGFRAGESSYIYYTNCDAYNVADTFRTVSSNAGNAGAGFAFADCHHLYHNKCRAWKCSDQGYEGADGYEVHYDSCWSFNNGYLPAGTGAGFKIAIWSATADPDLFSDINYCVSAYNKHGFNENNDPHARTNSTYYNNIAYHNSGAPFVVYQTEYHTENQNIYRNNIAYVYNALAFIGQYVHSNNSWDILPLMTLTDADFVSVDSTGITAARQADGSLPDNNCYTYFLRPTETSRVINAGTDTISTTVIIDSINFKGVEPDLGPFEYDLLEPPTYPLVSTTGMPINIKTRSATGIGYVTYDGGLNVSRKLCYGTSSNPTILNNVVDCGTGTGTYSGAILGLTPGATYHIRAYAANSEGESYGNDVEFTTPSEGVGYYKGKVVYNKGKRGIAR